MSRIIRVLFVCHANQCRSPLAEAVFVRLCRSRGIADAFEVDSAGTWAADGVPPHRGSIDVAARNGFDLRLFTSTSRSIVPDDMERFDEIVAMDRANLADLQRLVRISAFGVPDGQRGRIRLLRQIANPEARGSDADVPDPVRSGPEAFDRTYALIESGCRALLDELTGGS